MLAMAIPIINFLLLFFLAFEKGEKKENKYGPIPSFKVRFPAQILGED